jgi:hypothetical protein
MPGRHFLAPVFTKLSHKLLGPYAGTVVDILSHVTEVVTVPTCDCLAFEGNQCGLLLHVQPCSRAKESRTPGRSSGSRPLLDLCFRKVVADAILAGGLRRAHPAPSAPLQDTLADQSRLSSNDPPNRKARIAMEIT